MVESKFRLSQVSTAAAGRCAKDVRAPAALGSRGERTRGGSMSRRHVFSIVSRRYARSADHTNTLALSRPVGSLGPVGSRGGGLVSGVGGGSSALAGLSGLPEGLLALLAGRVGLVCEPDQVDRGDLLVRDLLSLRRRLEALDVLYREPLDFEESDDPVGEPGKGLDPDKVEVVGSDHLWSVERVLSQLGLEGRVETGDLVGLVTGVVPLMKSRADGARA